MKRMRRSRSCQFGDLSEGGGSLLLRVFSEHSIQFPKLEEEALDSSSVHFGWSMADKGGWRMVAKRPFCFPSSRKDRSTLSYETNKLTQRGE